MSTNPVRRKSSRHIDIRVHFCRELYRAGVMGLIPLHTHLMVADTLTKSLPGKDNGQSFSRRRMFIAGFPLT
jgi:hypothetical protein